MELLNRFSPYILIGLFVFVAFFSFVRPQSKANKHYANGISKLAVGDTIITIAGMYAEISEMHTDYLIVKIIPSMVEMKISPKAVSVFPDEIMKAEMRTEGNP